MTTSVQGVGVATHTDIIGDVVESRSRGQRGVVASRHASYFMNHGIHIICDHVIGDTFETLSFPTSSILRSLFPPRFYAPSYLKHNLTNLTMFLDDMDESASNAFVIRTAADLMEARSGSRLGIILCFQGCSPLEDVSLLLRTYFRLGVRILNITSALVPNLAVGHAQGPLALGLTDFGRELLLHAADLGMIVDLSGVSEQSFWDIMEFFPGHVMASTTNAATVHPNASNFKDDQLKAIGARGGVVGVIFNDRSVGGNTVSAVADHVEHIAREAGTSSVAVGPNVVEPHMYPKETYERVFRDVGFWSGNYPEGMDSFAGIRLLAAEMERRGWTTDQTNGLVGENAYQMLYNALGAMKGF